MQNITSITELRNAIQLLKIEQDVKEQKLKEQFNYTLKSLKPVNILKSTFKSIVSSPYLFDNILGIGIGLASGYLSRKIVGGASRNILKMLFGSIVHAGVTTDVSRHPEVLKLPRQVIIKNIFRKKELNP